MLRYNRFRIKLPGTEKHKKVLLIILIIIAIVVISYDALGNRNNRNSENSKEKQEETIKAEDMSETNIANTTDKENAGENTKVANNAGKEESKYSTKENELYNDAYTLFFLHDYNNAIDKANLLINEFPNNAMGYNIRGIAKAYNGDYDGGMNDIDKSLSIDSDYGYARFNKALTYELYEKFDKALGWYNKDLEVEEYVWSYYGIASIYGRKGDVENTMNYLNKAIQLDSSVKNIAKNEHDFDPVKESKEFQGVIYN